MLGKGQMVKIGLVGAIFFLLATTPLGVWTVPNALMAMSLVLLLRRKFEISFFREPARQVPEELINPVDSIDGVLCGGWTQAHARLGYAVDGHVA